MMGLLSRFTISTGLWKKSKNGVKVSDEPEKEAGQKEMSAPGSGSGSNSGKISRVWSGRKEGKGEQLMPIDKPAEPLDLDKPIACPTPRASIANDGLELYERQMAERQRLERMEFVELENEPDFDLLSRHAWEEAGIQVEEDELELAKQSLRCRRCPSI